MANIRIMMVEDSLTQAMRLRYVLESEGFEVHVAANGEEALLMLEKILPDLIITDVMMPRMNGYDLCRRIRADERLRDIPVMLVTTLSDPTDVIRALEAGADNFTTKPYNEQALISRIRYILANQEIRRQRGSDIGIEVFFAGKKYFINSTRIQMIDFLLSTYESAIQKNQELFVANNKLKEALDNIITLQRNYRQLLETSKDAILVFDRNHIVRYANPAAHALFSNGKALMGAAVPVEQDLTGQSELEIQDPYGNTVYLDVRSVSTDWDGEMMTLAVLRDITEAIQLRKELEQMSLTDDLTGLYNRRGFKLLSERMLKLARRMQSNLFILFGDLDGLKHINDTLGHIEGDNAIQAIAGCLRQAFRETDIIARLGGDEFAVIGLINDSFIPEALIERLQALIARFNSEHKAAFSLSISLGIETLSYATNQSIDEVLHRADTLMYEQKQKKKQSSMPSA
ncbi:MAG: diguanylate cyclase [Rectinemataceae bacterium]